MRAYFSLLFFLSGITLAIAQDWTTPVQISQGGYNDNPDFCIDQNGVIHCAWSHRITDNYRKIYYSKSLDEGETWSEPEDVLQNDTMWMSNPNLVVDTANNLYLCYDHDTYHPGSMLVMLIQRMDGFWTEPDTISVGMYGSHNNEVVIDRYNRLYIFWYRNESFYYRYIENNTWSNIHCPYDNNNYHSLANAVIDSQNNIHCIGSFHYAGQNHYDDRAIYFQYDYEYQSWSEPVILSDDKTWWGFRIALDNNDWPHVVWGQHTTDSIPSPHGTYYAAFTGSNWNTLELIVENDAEDQVIAVDQNNTTHICNREKPEEDTLRGILTHYFKNNDAWEQKVIDHGANAIRDLKLVHRNRQLHLVYGKYQIFDEPPYDIYFSKFDTPNSIKGPNNNSERIVGYPNPFRNKVTCEFYIQKSSRVNLQVYGINGQLIHGLINKHLPNGRHAISWNGKDEQHNEVPAGLYLFRLQTENHCITKSLIKQ
jgi:hypothetical protein